MHIIAHNQDAITEHREAQRAYFDGEIDADTYLARFHQIDDAHSTHELCDSGDGRLVTAVLGGRRFCSACWVAARGRAVRR